MTKYSSALKAKIISEYNHGSVTMTQLAQKYHIGRRQINVWIQTFRLQGAVRHSKSKRTFTTDFKLSVINYYQTHEVTTAEVAAKFDLLPSQVSHWRTLFQTSGVEALRPHRKGRKLKQMKSSSHSSKAKKKLTSAEISENERLKAEIVKLKEELYDVRLDAAILKKAAALFGNSRPGKKR